MEALLSRLAGSRWKWAAVLALVAVGGMGASSFLGNGEKPAFRTQAVEQGKIVSSVSSSGTLNAVVTIQVGSQVSGQIREVLADYNAEVKAGDVIARLDPDIFETKVAQAAADLEVAKAAVLMQEASLERARAEVANAQAAVAGGSADATKAEVQREEARRDMERKKALIAKGFISEADRDKAQAALDSAAAGLRSASAQTRSREAGLAAAEAAVRMGEAQLLNAQAQVAQREAALRQAQVDLEHTFIRAPTTGTIILRAVEPGQTVAASLQSPILFTVAENLAHMQVETSVDEADVGRIKDGQLATFTVDSFPGQTFSGTVRQIRKAAQVVQNVVTYTVVITAENPDLRLLPGMTANVRIVTDMRDKALKVPNAALRFRPANTDDNAKENKRKPGRGPAGAEGRAFMKDGAGLKAVPLKLGIGDGQWTEVVEGDLKEGQEVVVGGQGGVGKSAKGGAAPPGPRFGF